MFEVRPFQNKTLSWWFMEKDHLDLSPVYQRRGQLWDRQHKGYLIDSILNDFDIPKIYIADFTLANTPLNTKNKRYAVIDGRQRFETIFDFFEGKIVLNKTFVLAENPILPLAELGYQDLKENYPRIASKFENFNLSVIAVITDDEEMINELFVRLNFSKPLTGAEVRNAMGGIVPELLRRIASHKFFQTRVRFQTSRGQDLNAAAKLLVTEFRRGFVDTKKTVLDRFVLEAVEEAVRSESPMFERAAKRVERILAQMTSVFLPRDALLGSQGQLPVYYWLTRELGIKNRGRMREFLVGFERARRRNRVQAKLSPDRADPELSYYDLLNRSTNDQGSLKNRFELLYRKFRERYPEG